MSLYYWLTTLRTYARRNEGQTMAEYGVVLAVITLGAVVVFGTLSGAITGAIEEVIAWLPGGDAPPAE